VLEYTVCYFSSLELKFQRFSAIALAEAVHAFPSLQNQNLLLIFPRSVRIPATWIGRPATPKRGGAPWLMGGRRRAWSRDTHGLTT